MITQYNFNKINLKISIKKLFILLELYTSFSIYGCAGYWWEAHKDLYEKLDTYNIHSIAVLPIRNSNLDSNETIKVNQYLIQGITKIKKKYILISPEECLEKLNRDSLTERYYNQLAAFYSSNTLSEEFIKDLGKSTGCDAIVLSNITDFTYHTYVDQNKIITCCGVGYRLYSVKNGQHLWGNYVESYVNTDLKSGPSPLIIVVKAGIDLLFLYTHN